MLRFKVTGDAVLIHLQKRKIMIGLPSTLEGFPCGA